MNAVEKPERAAEFLAHVRALLNGERTIPALEYKQRGPEFHLSDFDLCLYKTYLRKTEENAPESSDIAILKFIRGRAIERIMATEADPAEKDGILCSVDYISPTWGLAEIKSVATDSSRFQPLDPRNGPYAHWLRRMKGYCTCYGESRITLFIYFMVGNTGSHRWGAPDREDVALRAWEYEFTPEELAENWTDVLERKDALEYAINHGGEMDDRFAAKADWECRGCEMSPLCPFFIRN